MATIATTRISMIVPFLRPRVVTADDSHHPSAVAPPYT
jgi:hypothetical protein